MVVVASLLADRIVKRTNNWRASLAGARYRKRYFSGCLMLDTKSCRVTNLQIAGTGQLSCDQHLSQRLTDQPASRN